MPVIVIIGAGITGLAAAYELSARGVPFQRARGLAARRRTDPHRARRRLHHRGRARLHPRAKPAAIELCDELGLGPRLISTTPPRTAFVLKKGRLHPLPSPSMLGIPTTWRGIAGYDLLSPMARARMALEPVDSSPARATQRETTSRSARSSGAGSAPAAVDLIAQPLLGGIHAGDIETLSIASLFPRLLEAETRRGSVMRAFRHTPRASAGDGLFRSLGCGHGRARHRDRAPAAAGIDSLRRRPCRDVDRGRAPGGVSRPTARPCRRAPSSWRVRRTRRPACWRRSTSAPRRCARRCRTCRPPASRSPGRDGRAASARRQRLRRRARVTTRCASPPARGCRRSGADGRRPGRCCCARSSAGRTIPARSICPTKSWSTSPRASSPGSSGSRAPPILARVYRWRTAGAQHNVGHIARVAEIESRLARHGGLFVAGSGFRSVGIPDCIADGRAAAAQAAAME